MEPVVEKQQWKSKETYILLSILALAALYFFSYFNRFAGLRSGDGEFSGGMALLSGRLPYRDYYTAGPPLNQIKAAIELSLFGKTLFVTRFAAVIERLVICSLLYIWLRRIFSPWASGIASLITVVVTAGDHTDPLASYNHDAILFAVLAGLLACLSLESTNRKKALSLGVLAGVASGLSFLTKQTVGLGAFVSVLLLGSIAIYRLHSARESLKWFGIYLAGFASPVIALALFLYRLGLLRVCLTMLFISGPAAKASVPHAFLTRGFAVAFDNPAWIVPAIVGTILSGLAIGRGVSELRLRLAPTPVRWLFFWLAGLALILSAELLALTNLPTIRDFSKCSVYFVLLDTTIFGFVILIRCLRSSVVSVRTWQVLIFIGVSWSVALMLSLSWPVFEAMALPGLALFLAAVLDGSTGLGRSFVFLVLAAMLFLAAWEKLQLPFSFDHQDEAGIRNATQRSNEPVLKGMRLPVETVRLLDETITTIDGDPSKSDTIFTYPEFGLLYPLSGRNPPTLAGSHNIDVVPDSFARMEAERLQKNPPAVILYARPSEENLLADEATWRGGRPSGQRELVSTLDQITSNYRLVGTYRLLPDDNTIRLYAKRR